jgi:hypothetical protein
LSLARSTPESFSSNSTEKRCANVAGVADILKKLDGCSVTPSSAANFDWSVDIFATTVTQSGLAANTAARQVNCQNLIAPCTPGIFLAARFDPLGVLFCGAPRLC